MLSVARESRSIVALSRFSVDPLLQICWRRISYQDLLRSPFAVRSRLIGERGEDWVAYVLLLQKESKKMKVAVVFAADVVQRRQRRMRTAACYHEEEDELQIAHVPPA